MMLVPFNMTGATSRIGTVYPSGSPEFNPVFNGVIIEMEICYHWEDATENYDHI